MQDLEEALGDSAYIIHEVAADRNPQAIHLQSEHQKQCPTFEIHSCLSLQKEKIEGAKCILYQFVTAPVSAESDAQAKYFVKTPTGFPRTTKAPYVQSSEKMPLKDRANSGRYSPAKGSTCSNVGFELDKTIPAQLQDSDN